MSSCTTRRAPSLALKTALPLAVALCAYATAETFRFQDLDLIAGFRQAGGTFEVVANLGPVTNFSGLAAGQTLSVSAVSPAQLRLAFPTLDNLRWSVSAAVLASSTNAAYPRQTLWLTRPRGEATEVAPAPWLRKSPTTQAQSANRIHSVPSGAANYGTTIPADPDRNSASAILLPAGLPSGYGAFVGRFDNANWQNTFQGNVESATPGGFEGSAVSRADLNELQPSTAGPAVEIPGTPLGYFDLHADGSLTFTRAGGESPPLPAPRIVQSGWQQGRFIVSFTTTNDSTARYRLCFTNLAGVSAPLSQWSRGSTQANGDGAVQNLEDDTVQAGRVYVIEVNR